MHFFLALIAGFSLFAKDTDMTPIRGADIVCGDHGGAFFINTKAHKVWQGDIGEKVGLDLTVTKFKAYRCPNCFDIEAKFEMDGQVLYYDLQLRAQSTGSPNLPRFETELTVVLTDKKDKETFSYKCQ